MKFLQTLRLQRLRLQMQLPKLQRRRRESHPRARLLRRAIKPQDQKTGVPGRHVRREARQKLLVRPMLRREADQKLPMRLMSITGQTPIRLWRISINPRKSNSDSAST
jgi:hypothetical protein